MMTTSPLISAKDICVSYQGKSVLDNISLDINEHDFVTVIGPNGAGKSVLLSCLMKLTPLTSGHISSQDNLTIGYVPQAFHADISLPMTVERFLLLGKHRRSFAHIENFPKHYQQTIDNTDIGDKLKKPLNILSGGEMQRVLVARALINQPQLLVLDEPAQNLDVAGQLAFYKLIDNLYQSSNISILMVSHELHLVMASTQRVICLYKHICCSGEPQMVMKDPEFISLFGNDMSKMMAVYQHQHSHTHHHE